MTDAPEVRYRAFISYSHADAVFGRRLHRWLEAYAVPSRLARRPGVPGRLSPIFRDREELSAAGDLSAQVRAALAQSAALVVVCSPRAAASVWVGREVALFRELHPGRPILAALIEGEPAEAFPAALSQGGAEPLAADFRDGRDGEKLGLLKLVAGLIGVGLDELIQRDAQRNLQRVTAVTAGAVVGMVAMGGLAAFAFNARAQAERDRAQAEGMVDFMMDDLRPRLKGVNRLDILAAVNDRALDYYRHQDLSRMPAASLLRRAEILQAMGEDDEQRGRFDRALAEAREASRTTAALLDADTDNPERIYAHAQSEFWVAAAERRMGNGATARAGLERYKDLTARLSAIDPANPDWRMEAGYGESNIATLMLRDDVNATGAEAGFRRALAHFQAAAAKKPGDADIKSDIADGHGWLADALRAQGKLDEASRERQAEEAIFRALKATEPKNETWAQNLLYNALGQARIDLDAGRYAEARARLLGVAPEVRRLAAADPENKELVRQRAANDLFLADATLRAGRPFAEARAALTVCSAPIARTDIEIRDFCALLAARLARAEGRSDDPAFQYLRQNRPRMHKTRRSQRWGIDFSRELADLA